MTTSKGKTLDDLVGKSDNGMEKSATEKATDAKAAGEPVAKKKGVSKPKGQFYYDRSGPVPVATYR